MSTPIPVSRDGKKEEILLLYFKKSSVTPFQWQAILKAMGEYEKYQLTEYTQFLMEEGYVDSDVYDHPPTAIDKFLNPTLR